jgi:rubrerythrin
MAKKTVGFVELEWTCKRCGTKNPGTQKTCSNCGAPMDQADQFELPEEQKLIADKAKLEQAQKGADIHCPYCNTRNPAGTPTCSQCGGDLREGKARAAGQVLGAFSDKPVAEKPCPSCGTPNPANAARCKNCGGDLVRKPAQAAAQSFSVQGGTEAPPKSKRTLLIGIAIGLCVCIGAIIVAVILSRSSEVTGVVQSVQWTRSIAILELGPVLRSDWQDQIPSDAIVNSCRDSVRETVSDPAPNAVEVCGTPYTVDKGGGVGEVVQDCVYEVHDQYCTYTVEDWSEVDKAVASGNDLNPFWPDLSLTQKQREGDRSEEYVVTFSTDSQNYDYTLSDATAFMQFTLGSQWTLVLNGFGGLVEVHP